MQALTLIHPLWNQREHGVKMSELSREVIQELVHLNSYRKVQGPMQSAHEALFRAKMLEFAEGLIEAAVEREELSARLAKTELCLKETIEGLNGIREAVSVS